jgi:hypothetical protein
MGNAPLQLLELSRFNWRFKEYNKDRRCSSIPEETKLLEQMLATGLQAY